MAIKINGDNSVANPGFTGDDTDTGLQVGTDELKLVTGGTARTTVDSSGNVGIGTTTVDEKLHVEGSSGQSTTIKVESTATSSERSAIEFFNGSISRGRVSGSNDFDGLTLDSSTTESAAVIRFRTGGASLSERVRIDSSGNVGIGVTTPSESLEVAGNGLKISGQTSGVTDEGLTFDWDSGNNNGRIFSESAGSSNLLFYTTSSGTRGERMRILSSGGLTFNGDTSTSNALDDYEEGSWTPTVSSGTVTASGTYTKIGNTVKIEAKLSSFSDRTTSNSVQVLSLPFTPANNQACGSIFGRYLTGGQTGIYADSNRLTFYTSDSSAYNPLEHNELNNALAEIYLFAVYRAA